MSVQTIPPIQEMTAAQRQELMEELWVVMSKSIEDIPSPAWHRKVLEERELAVERGEDEFIDWEDAKAEIWAATVKRKA